MDKISNIPAIGWVVIAFIAILIFIIIMKRGLKLGSGDKTLSVGEAIDRRFADYQNDDELRKKLFRMSGEIDDKTRADEFRILRDVIHEKIKEIFTTELDCPLPPLAVSEILKNVFEDRILYNCMKEKLTITERTGYMNDILFRLRRSYEAYLLKTQQLPCGIKNYPKWQEIEGRLKCIIILWAKEMVKIIITRIKQKIEMYESESENFKIEEVRKMSVDFPIEKNKEYIRKLGG